MILVTGVSGGLGGLILDGLARRDGLTVVGGTRAGSGSGAGDRRRIDFDDPASLHAGFAGVDVLVVISAGYAEDDVVYARHGAVADAATTAGVRHVIYTSLASSGESMTIALPHRWTEDRLAAGPFTTTILRNGLYAEVPVGLATAGAAQAAATGEFAAPFGEGKVSVVAKEDLADAAVRVAAESQQDLAAGRPSRHAGRVYELEGDLALGGADIAQALTTALGRPVGYRPASLAETRAGLAGSGLEPYQITHALSLFSNVIAGRAQARSRDLPALLDTPPRPVLPAITAAVTLSMAGLSGPRGAGSRGPAGS
ncbi:Rossmann-fold NAD(P)-binding domain-containing protein [Actinacidiphila epipremni]|uniref:NmrA family NAD(P)-binding protein n=1 Tax=Actinacidiphila epipremni TaxID=2053013 RepID=A0ABX0ZEJ3_9ACTN|nr:NmrA family NAD(P)-binding protein [Actinacidiphila epipremni]NJP42200.1 NmrA family NAD(P)-binding protein [Actinacidiphila epipremni]